jgi:FKBP-type peptidyl-prolyl cis-trans isomerase
MVLSFRPARLASMLAAVFACVIAGMTALTPLGAAPRGEFSAEDRDIIEKRWPDAGQTASGMRYMILKEGAGPKVRNRQRVSVLYKGSLLNGVVFSEKSDAQDPFKFSVGSGEVILGWEEALLDMRAGEKRLLIIPFALGYGLRGREPDIPNRATLVFEIELLKVE